MPTPTLDDLLRMIGALERARATKTVIEELFDQELITETERETMLIRLRAKIRTMIDNLPRDAG